MKLWSSRGSEEMKDVERGVRGEEEEKGERENGNGEKNGRNGERDKLDFGRSGKGKDKSKREGIMQGRKEDCLVTVKHEVGMAL